MSYPKTQNALICAAIGEPFEIKKRPVPKPGPGQVLVKIISAALNPVDELIRVKGIHVKGTLMSTYPAICGSDAAGTVAVLGEGVDNFEIGDRVIFQNWFVPDRGTFQQYALSDAGTTAKIPENLSFDEAATIPIGLATAVMGFYGGKASEERGGAGLPVPWEESGRNRFLEDEPIFITGGASSVGQFVIQMAKLSGFSPIITTASSKHTEYCKLAGATHIIDYHTTPYSTIPSAVTSILSSSPTTSKPLKFTWDCIGNEETNELCWTMLAPSGTMIVARCAPVYWPNVVLPAQAQAAGEEGKKAYFSAGNVNLPINKVLGENLYENLEEMLRDGRVKPNHLEVLPGGLAAIEGGLTRIISGKAAGVKLIVHPQETASLR